VEFSVRYAELIAAVKQFKKEKELATDPYPMIFQWTQRFTDIKSKTAGAAAFLYTWNSELYTDSQAKFWRVADAVQEVLDDATLQGVLAALDSAEIDSQLNAVSDNITRAYQIVSGNKLIQMTGASKVLHVLNPKLFVMWDGDIRTHYHTRHGSQHDQGDKQCYLAFLQDMREELDGVLEDKSKELLLDELGAIAGYGKTLAKALDEHNFIHKSAWKSAHGRSTH
jgi:hypothetical protein